MIYRTKLIGGFPNLLGRFIGLILLIGVSGGVRAQLPTATILGVVKDSTGAVVPGATVTARNVDTGQARNVETGADGSFRFQALPVGNYEVRSEHSGFKTEVRSGLTLTVAQEAVVNFTLEVGAIEQTVSVTAEAPLVNTTSGSLGGLVSEQKMADLPLNGRNYIDLTLLQPGIAQSKNLSPAGATVGLWYSSNGAPVRSNNYMLDGAPLVDGNGINGAAANGTTLGMEGIREYRVITNSFSAEYGMTMGSQMVLVSKNGTNQFHGSLFEYLRNSALDARNFFDYKSIASQRRLPPFTRNNFGGSAGGPIRKDKTFFFTTYEGLRERLGLTTVSTVPAAGCHGSGGATIANAACLQLGSASSVTIAPQSAPLLSLYPIPNLGANQYTFPFSQPNGEDYGQVRVDQNFSSKDTVFSRVTIDDVRQTKPFAYPQYVDIITGRHQYDTLSENHIFSPALLNTARFSFSRTWTLLLSPSGISGPQLSFVAGKEIGNINIGGISSLGGDFVAPNLIKQNIFTWSDDLFYTYGRHSFKFGTLINRFQQYLLVSTNNRGTATFADVPSFLAAVPTSLVAVTSGSILDRTYHFTTLGFYVQDDVRVLSNLTLNAGLRYEIQTVPMEQHGHGAALRDIQHDAATTLGPPFLNPSLKNFSPRLGFAWDVQSNGKTAVRGGFGLLYDIGAVVSSLIIGTTATPPFSSLSTVTNPPALTLPFVFPAGTAGKALRIPDYHLAQPHMLQYNLTVERQLPGDMALTVTYAGSRGLHLMLKEDGNAFIPQILPGGQYFWPATGLFRQNPNWNSIEFNTAGGDSYYNSLQAGLLKRLSRGLQLQSAYTWSHVIDDTQAQLGTVETNSTFSFGSNPFNRKTDRGLAPFDITQNWRLNAIYNLPQIASGPALSQKLLNGWTMSGILSLQSGYPFSPSLQANRSRSGVNNAAATVDRPNLLSGRSATNIVSGTTAGCPGVAAGQKLGGPQLYYDACAFSLQPAGFLGNAGRDILRGPGFATLDFSLVKDTKLGFLGESGAMQFRAEFFNILNRANFGTPSIGQGGTNSAAIVYAGRTDTDPVLSTAGRLTSTASSSRQIQFALRVIF